MVILKTGTLPAAGYSDHDPENAAKIINNLQQMMEVLYRAAGGVTPLGGVAQLIVRKVQLETER